MLQLPVRLQAGRRGQADGALGQGSAHPREGPQRRPDHGRHVATPGTGIAPYRGFIRRLFVEKTPFGEAFKGLAWLFLGVANSDALLYDDEWQAVLESGHPRDAREGGQREGPRVGGEAQGVEEGGPLMSKRRKTFPNFGERLPPSPEPAVRALPQS